MSTETLTPAPPLHPADGLTRCPACGGLYFGILALDVHRRHPRSPIGCHYREGEHRGGYRPSLYARPAHAR